MTTKTLYLIRHARSFFNEVEGQRDAEKDRALFDAELSATGLEQVKALQSQVEDIYVDAVVCSPLTRAIQTAQGAFPDHPEYIVTPLCREILSSICDLGRPLNEVLSKHERLVYTSDPRFHPHKPTNLKEDIWYHVSDHVKADVSFENAVDIFLEIGFYEGSSDARKRAEEFKEWIFHQFPDKHHIAIVSHHDFLVTFCDKYFKNCQMHKLIIDKDRSIL